ncbi:pyridoxamine 5'-phosphate oxidase family protein [Jatrophihabitans fulvus]
MTDTERTQSDEVAKVADLARGIRIAMLTTVDTEGKLTARPMAQQEVEFDGDLWFFVEADSRTAANINGNANTGVTLSSDSTWISLSGHAEIVRDVAKAKDLWNPWVEAWLPEGPEDPNVVLIKFTAASAEYWDTPGGKVASIASFVKAKLTGKRYEGGENESVRLPNS